MEMDACGSPEITLMNKLPSKWCETAARKRKRRQGGEAKKKAADEHSIKKRKKEMDWDGRHAKKKKQGNVERVEL